MPFTHPNSELSCDRLLDAVPYQVSNRTCLSTRTPKVAIFSTTTMSLARDAFRTFSTCPYLTISFGRRTGEALSSSIRPNPVQMASRSQNAFPRRVFHLAGISLFFSRFNQAVVSIQWKKLWLEVVVKMAENVSVSVDGSMLHRRERKDMNRSKKQRSKVLGSN